MPAVLALAARFGARGLRVVGVTQDGADEERRKVVAEAAKEEKMTYPTLLDADGAWGASAAIGGVPSFVVAGKDGRVTYRHAGKLVEGTPAFDALAAAIEGALAK